MTTGTCYTPDEDYTQNLTDKQKQTRRRFNRVKFHTANNPFIADIKSGAGSPCTDDQGISEYFNNPKVRQQLRIKNNDIWTPCADIDYNQN